MSNLDAKFVELTGAVRTQGERMAKALLNDGLMYGEPMAVDVTKAPPFFDDKKISDYFDRTTIEKEYIKTLTSPSADRGVNVAIASVLQSDFVAGCEQSYRLQHKQTRVRSLCHAASRRSAQGDKENGVVARGMVDWTKRFLQMGDSSNGG